MRWTQLRPRRTLLILLTVLLVIFIFSFSRIVAFAHLFGLFGEHAGIRLTQLEIAEAHNSTTPDPRTPVVPKIFHQIFHNWKQPGNATLPPHWQAARDSCLEFNPDWELKLWNMEESRTFIEDEYPWFLEVYDSYRFPIQRIDALKYFILRHFGGIYVDLDNGCATSLDALTYYPAFTTDGDRGTLSNNIMGGAPQHPFFHLLTEELLRYKWNYILPYVMISYQSGQWFVTAVWERYHALLSGDWEDGDGTVDGFEGNGYAPLHRVLMDGRPNTDPWVFFTQTRGGTWANWDSDMFNWIGKNIIAILLGVVAVVGALIFCCTLCLRRRGRRTKDYQALPRSEEMGEIAP